MTVIGQSQTSKSQSQHHVTLQKDDVIHYKEVMTLSIYTYNI